MTTYNSYEEAKIANPDEEIKHLNGKIFVNENSGVPYERRHDWLPARASQFCMTVEKFLADGRKGVNGDVYLDDEGALMVLGVHVPAGVFNEKGSLDFKMHILRAEALEDKLKSSADKIVEALGRPLTPSDFGVALDDKPKRMKVEYVECDNLQDALDKFESMSGFEFYPDDKGCGDRINSVRYLALAYGNNSLYHRIETEIDERQEFIDSACKVLDWNIAKAMGALYDSGKFKLVKGE